MLITEVNNVKNEQKNEQMKSVLADVIELLEPLNENEKRQAFALLQGMIIGKELAEKKNPHKEARK